MSARRMPFPIARRHIAGLISLLLALLAMPAFARNNIAAELVVDGPARPGGQAELALHFRPAPGWHGYWANPGDAGFGMTLDWTLPESAATGTPLYPLPRTLVIGGLMNHVYEGEYAVLVPLRLPPGAKAGQRLAISVKADWLACTDKLCVPEGATLSTVVIVGGDRDDGAVRDSRFDAWRAAIPPLLKSEATFAIRGGTLRIAVPVPEGIAADDPHVFVETEDLVRYAAPQAFHRKDDRIIAAIALRDGQLPDPARIDGLLRLRDGGGLAFIARPGRVPGGGVPLGAVVARASAPLPWLLLAALAGGLLLNLMPCVFPILSLKGLSLARAGESQSQARREGLAYTAGAVLACLALGATMLLLRAGGEQVGWAFQLQEPGVVVGLLLLATAITANLAGVFALPAIPLTRAGEPAGAFATGLLAAFVATPCTGPFMAVALGAALLLPPLSALALFAVLGVGLALPFLLLGFVPAFRRMLPRPGPWMERFRHWMAVPMGLTAVALLWLASRLGGAGFAALAALVVAGLLLALWAAGQRQRRGRGAWAAFLLIAAPFALFAAFALPAAFDSRADGNDAGLLGARPFSEEALTRARATGRPVFLWFTADWCITCKVNERVAIEREPTRAAFAKAGVIVLRGDWTRRDPAITRFLTAHGAAGVPLYLWYAPGDEGRQLPQVLGPDSLVRLARGRGNAPQDPTATR